MTELRQALYALVDHPPVAPTDIEVVAARGARFVRRRRVLRGAATLAVVVLASAAGFGLAQQSSDPSVLVATDGAGAPVSFPDDANDALGPAVDILQVDWAPGLDVGEQHGGYVTSLTVAGTPLDSGSYVSYGDFPSDVPGEQCQLYHLLTPGTTAYANAFCGTVENGTRRFIGRVEGSQVTSLPTAAGGTLLTATFDDSALPSLLEAAGRKLSNLSAFTCTSGTDPGSGLCIPDEATSTLTYRL